MNEFDVKDGAGMTPEHHQLQASAEAQKQVSQLWSFIHTLQVLASFLCGFQDTSNVVFCDNLPSAAHSVRWTECAARHCSAMS